MSSSRLIAAWALTISLLTLYGCGNDKTAAARIVDTPPTNAPIAGDQAPCPGARADHKNAYFGDLHTHTSYSLDAYFFNATNDPRAAHRFAKGEDGGLPGMGTDDPYTQQRKINIGRPLDFNAVTDHAEFLGGFVNTCGRNGTLQKQCDERLGKGIRADVVNIAAGNTSLQQQLLQSLIAISPTNISAWNTTKQINDEEYEPCKFTTLHAYEFTSNEKSQMFHRNVIFKGERRAFRPLCFRRYAQIPH